MRHAPRSARLVAGLLVAAIGPTACAGGIRIGDLAPDFTLEDASGAPVSLSDHQGAVVLVSFWATWCGPCRQELPELGAIQRELGDDVVLLLVSDEEHEVTQEYLRGRKVEATSLRDPDGEVFGAYGISGIPMLFVIDGEGRIRELFKGYAPGQGERVKAAVGKLLKT